MNIVHSTKRTLLLGCLVAACSKSEAPADPPGPGPSAAAATAAPSAARTASTAPRDAAPPAQREVAQRDASVVQAKDAAAPECPEGRVPAGIDFTCVKLCETSADCKKGEECRPTSWDMGGGMYAHDKACF